MSVAAVPGAGIGAVMGYSNYGFPHDFIPQKGLNLGSTDS